MRYSIVLALVGCLAGAPTYAQDVSDTESTESTADEERGRGLFGSILLYLPNRVFDLTDIVRARVRVAPGVAVQARVTQLVSANVGSYGGVYAGLHGPRGKRRIPWPVGFEAYSGISASVAKVGTSGPYYGPGEVGAGFQALLFGVDLGVAPLELLDFLTSTIGWDFRNDDL
ncbi:MAG: hypothetical protein JSU66_13100 [Deltaproteobacteria bacterium]|nr:MAG: hypothetical protein JSU66_13100 [Deltaproteobacteria bacterium]